MTMVCYAFNGYTGAIRRILFAYGGGNYVYYDFGINTAAAAGSCATLNGSYTSGVTDISQAKHPAILIAKAINTALSRIPSNADTSRMAYIGVPFTPTGSTNVVSGIWIYTSGGALQANYCYISGTQYVACVFGPS